MEVICKFRPTQTVELIHDPERLPRMVTQIFIGSGLGVRYELSCGEKCSAHYEEEIKAHNEDDASVGFKIRKQP